MRMTRTKAVVAAIGAVLTVGGVALADNVFDWNDGATVIAALVLQVGNVVAVWAVPNKPVPTGADYSPRVG